MDIEPRLDLSPLDPRRDPDRWERMVAGVLARASIPDAIVIPLVRGPLATLAGWARPLLAAAAAIVALSLVSLGGQAPAVAVAASADEPATMVEALAVPEPVAGWITEERGPQRGDLLVALDEMP